MGIQNNIAVKRVMTDVNLIHLLRGRTNDIMLRAEERDKGKWRENKGFIAHMESINKSMAVFTDMVTCESDHPEASNKPVEVWDGKNFLGYLTGSPPYNTGLLGAAGLQSKEFNFRLVARLHPQEFQNA